MRRNWISIFALIRKSRNPFIIAIEIKAAIMVKIGIPTPLRKKDRSILEEVILPYFGLDSKFRRILFVGCEKFTWHYKRIFCGKEYWTIDPVEWNAIFGAQRHIVGYLNQIDRYFEKNSLDLIVCNGVLGYGLNNPREIEISFGKCFSILKEGGILLIGWNDLKKWSFLPLEKYKSLQLFQPFVFPPLATQKYQTQTQNRHIFSFYIKPNDLSP
jgi:SAM-dependent methyltransferase